MVTEFFWNGKNVQEVYNNNGYKTINVTKVTELHTNEMAYIYMQ